MNTETGLPELPEEYVWRVTRSKYDIVTDVKTGAARQVIQPSKVHIIKVKNLSNWSEWKKDNGSYYRIPGIEIEQRIEEKKFLIFPYKQCQIRVRNAEPERAILSAHLSEDFDEKEISTEAVKLFKKFETALKQISLYGDYPPKKLGN